MSSETYLDTTYPTIILNKQLIDPTLIYDLSESKGEKRHTTYHDYSEPINATKQSVVYACSDLLKEYNLNHDRYKWSMDVIRYNLQNETKGVDSGLAWHCENDNGNNLITVLLYIHLDDTIIDGNLRYINKDNIKKIINIKTGTTIIMDGNVQHKPQNPYGSGKRDLIIVSFSKEYEPAQLDHHLFH